MADHRDTKGSSYQVGQRVWLSTQDLPWSKLSSRFVGPFPISKVINPIAVHLKLPISMRVHPTFHVSHVKHHVENPLVPASPPPPPPPPPPRILDGKMLLKNFWLFAREGAEVSTWWIARGMVLKNGLRCHPRTSWTRTSFVNSMIMVGGQ